MLQVDRSKRAPPLLLNFDPQATVGLRLSDRMMSGRSPL